MNTKLQKTILLVEDELLIAMTEKIMLEKYGYKVITANSGENAVEIVEKYPSIDLILMDLNLGNGINGTEAAVKILAQNDLPVVFLSSHTERDVVEKTEGITSYGYIVKDSGETVIIASIKMAFRLFEARMKEIEKEEALRESENRYRHIIENTEAGYFLLDRKGYFQQVNPAWLRMHKYETAGEVIGQHFSITQPRKDMQHKNVEHLLGGQKLINGESSRLCKDGSIGYHTFSARPVGNEGRTIGLEGFLIDITDRKRTEDALEKRMMALTRPMDDPKGIIFEDLFNLADIQCLQNEFAEATGVASIITHPDGTPITEPSSFCRLCNDIIRKTEKGLTNCYRSDAVLGQLSLHGPTIQPCMSGGLWDAGAGISVGGHHIANWLIGQVRDASQTEKQMLNYAREIGADENEVIEAFREVPAMSREQFTKVAQVLFTLANQLSAIAYQNVQQARFITELKQVEEELRSQHNLLEGLFESLPVGALVFNPEGRLIQANFTFTTLTGYTAEDAATLESWCNRAYPDPTYREEVLADWLKSKQLPEAVREFKVTCRDGSIKDIEFRGIFLEDGRAIVTLADISERKKSDDAIKTLLSEKEVLLKEVHHRIKNNIYSIESLLYLQSQSITNPDAVSVLLDAIGRVRSMRLLYDKLLLSDDYRDVSVRKYMNDLINTIMALFPDNSKILIEKQIDDFKLSPKQISPLGIIVNELLTNIMKYAFTNRETGLLRILLQKNENQVTLTIEDNGNGLPEGFDINSAKTFGLMLVKMLSKQIKGNFRMESRDGTKCYLEFDI